MAEQFKGARIHVANGSTTVYQVWTANGSVVGGPFQASEALSWEDNGSGVGAGFFVGDIGSRIDFYRTSGSLPIVGNTLTGGASGASFTISSFPRENLSALAPRAAYPAEFLTSTTQGGINAGDEFFIDTSLPVGNVALPINSDNFALAIAWSGATQSNVECQINRERTSVHGWPLPTTGMRGFLTLIKETIRQIDALVATLGGGGSTPGAYTGLTLTTPWVNVSGRAALAYTHADGVVYLKGYVDTGNTNATADTAIVTALNGLPSGRRPADRLDFPDGEPFSIEADGSIMFRGLGGRPPSPISLNGISFVADGS